MSRGSAHLLCCRRKWVDVVPGEATLVAVLAVARAVAARVVAMVVVALAAAEAAEEKNRLGRKDTGRLRRSSFVLRQVHFGMSNL